MQVTNQYRNNIIASNSTKTINSQVITTDKKYYDTVLDIEKELSSSNTTKSETLTSIIYNKYAHDTGPDCPYSYLADEFEVINYNGVQFQCDYNKNALCLGDISNEEEVLTIPLSEGGSLKVNRNNLDELAQAIGMFSPEDVKRILDAIATDAKLKSKQTEIDSMENKTYQNISEDILTE